MAVAPVHIPPLSGATGWLNSEPLGPAELRGHVVVVNFWTLTCINWLRQEPYVRAWSQAYRDDGLITVGVHTPEFSFEHDIDGVLQATKERAIDYPVAVDSDYAVWNAFGNATSSSCSVSSASSCRSKGPPWRPRPTGTTWARRRHISATPAAS